ncbi:MAG: trypsin-like peptidase domain-containing protein [Deltaproteobacteria bacterium]|nr:trypsin-like peptidase domain-containing protein [Deltaproteobacteria bacterium]
MKKIVLLAILISFISAVSGSLFTAFIFKNIENSSSDKGRHKETQVKEPSIHKENPKISSAKVNMDFSHLVEKYKNLVVHISTSSGKGNPYLLRRYHGYGPQNEGSLGTGIIISSDGLIVTNYHVIKGASRIMVKLADGKTKPAFLKGRDAKTDVALIKIKADNLQVAPLGDSSTEPIGAWVVAIGNPFGLSHTVTAGIISGKNRKDLNIGKSGYWNLIQTDAAINPGNSGGPLINMRGQVIGINTLVDTRGPGIGYAIPINMVKKVIPHLAKWGQVARSFLGVTVAAVDQSIANRYQLPGGKGAIVVSLTSRGPAARAGLLKGDIIVEFNGKPIVDDEDISWEASIAGIGQKITMKVYRDHKYKLFEVTMGSHPDNPASSMKKLSDQEKKPFGIHVTDSKGVGLSTTVVVSKVEPGSIGAKYGIKEGDHILNIGKNQVRNTREYFEELSKLSYGQNVMVLIDSAKSTSWLIMPYK